MAFFQILLVWLHKHSHVVEMDFHCETPQDRTEYSESKVSIQDLIRLS